MRKENDQHQGDDILTEEKHAVNKLSLQGDFSIAGASEQLPNLERLLASVDDFTSESRGQELLCEIDLSGVQDLDISGIQLLAVFFHALIQQGVVRYSLNLSDEYREKIHLHGFDNEILVGERT